MGEAIRLTLSFTNTGSEVRGLDLANYDRAGRLHIDRYALDPEGVDPLRDYFDRGLVGLGGLRRTETLSERPTEVQRTLNEYIQIRQPGRYQLRVESARVEGVLCASGPIELVIRPADAQADAMALERARTLMRGREESQREGLRQLRFLQTEEAAQTMVRLMARTPGPEDAGINVLEGFLLDLAFGLYGSPHREAILDAMDAALAVPDAQISPLFVDTLVRLRAQQERPGYLPQYPTEPESQRRWRRLETTYQEHRREIRERVCGRLLDGLGDKEARASDVAVATLLELNLRASSAVTNRLQQEIGTRLPNFAPTSQTRFLRDRWRQVVDPALVPALQAIADADGSDPNVRTLALRRLMELAPEEGRRRIVAELGRHPLRLGYAVREQPLLPLGPVPALDEVLATGVERHDHEFDLRARLLAQYGSPAILERVRAVQARHPRGSDTAEGALLAYLARVDARAGQDLIARVRAADTVLKQGVLANELAAAMEYDRAPSIELALIAMLRTEAPHAITTAARALQKHGSARGKEALFAALARSPSDPQVEDALTSALLRGRGWVLTEAERTRLDELRITTQAVAVQDAVSVMIVFDLSGSVLVHVGEFSSSSPAESLAPASGGARRHFVLPGGDVDAERGVRPVRARALDDLVFKLAQYPAGTQVHASILSDAGEANEVGVALRGWLEAHGLVPL